MRAAFLFPRAGLAAILSVTCPAFVNAQGDDVVVTPPAAPESEAAPALCDTHGLSTLFRCVPRDLWQFPQGRGRSVLITGTSLTLGSLLLDDEVAAALMDVDQDTAVDIAEHLGEAGLHSGIPAAAYLVAKATGQPEAAALSVMLIRTQLVNGAITRSLKMLPRPRPYQDVATPMKGSFPSGHASAAFATATVLQRRWGWRVGVPAFALAAYVGTSRLQNLHYLSDVVFGATVGITSGLSVSLPTRRRVPPE